MQTEAENPSPASDSPAGESAPSADHIQEREGEETRPSGETASLRPDFGNSPILIDAIKRIGRKRLAHGVGTEEIREYFGFGAIESRQTVQAVLAQADAETALTWSPHAAFIIEAMTYLPAPARSRERACKMFFEVWVEVTSRMTGKFERMKPWDVAEQFARTIMITALPEHMRKTFSPLPPSPAQPPEWPQERTGPCDFDLLTRLYDQQGPITDAARAGQHLILLASAGAGALASHSDGLLSALGSLLCSIGTLLVQYDRRTPDLGMEDDRTECERRLRDLLEAVERSGFTISSGSQKGIPDPQNIGWCARQVRASLADIEFLDLPPYKHWLAEPAIQEDPETIGLAFQSCWTDRTCRPSPITDFSAIAAVRDLQSRLDDEWAKLDRHEKARQVVMACLRRAGVSKPSKLFDAERKKEERAQQGG
jgi:hypothetical protein